MNLVAILTSVGAHVSGWRHPDAWTDTVESFEKMKYVAQLAQRGKMDALFLPDGNGVRDMGDRGRFEATHPDSRPATFEPLTLLSALAQLTKNIALVATATTTYDEPYLLARRFASLDHLSDGRAGWNIVTTAYGGESRNFGYEVPIPKNERYERAAEFVQVVTRLWDSWAPDAFLQDKASGRYLDADRVQALNHRGKHFSVAGPLNATRPTQGRPVLFHAGQSEAGRELAAQYADCVFTLAPTKGEATAYTRELKARAVAHGRAPSDIRILPGVSLLVGRTAAQAAALAQELTTLIPPGLGVSTLSKALGMDLSGFSMDDPVPLTGRDGVGADVPGETLGETLGDAAETQRLTIRQAYQRLTPAIAHAQFEGAPSDIADQMEDWHRSGACDGFMIAAPVMPKGLEDVVDFVIPELQRRGLFRAEYSGATARENMGLPEVPRFCG